MTYLAEPRTKAAKIWARDPLDWYVEPEWCSARLFEEEPFEGSVHDPAAGLCRIVHSARGAGLVAYASDIEPRLPEVDRVDFLDPAGAWPRADNIVCNPPFGPAARGERPRAELFVEHALRRAPTKVAMLLPATWHLGDKRSRWLESLPLYRVWFLSPRPSMPPGAVIEAGVKPGGGTTDYAWYVFLRGYEGPWQGRALRREAG